MTSPHILEAMVQALDAPDFSLIKDGMSVDEARVLVLLEQGITLEELASICKGLKELCTRQSA